MESLTAMLSTVQHSMNLDSKIEKLLLSGAVKRDALFLNSPSLAKMSPVELAALVRNFDIKHFADLVSKTDLGSVESVSMGG